MNPNPMSELKAKDCPLCDKAPETSKTWTYHVARCVNRKCSIFGVWIPIDQWNTRPREREIEALLRKAVDDLHDHRSDLFEHGHEHSASCVQATIAKINSALGKGGE